MKKKQSAARRNPSPLSYVERTYRHLVETGPLISSYVRIEETDLHIMAEVDVSEEARELVLMYRHILEGYIRRYPDFLTSLVPLPDDPCAHPLIREMLRAGMAADVGPMAAVAGAIAEYGTKGLQDRKVHEIIVENGGDIYLSRTSDCMVEIFAGSSPLSRTIGVLLPAESMPCSVCTSSGTIGHSLSFGTADAVTVVAANAALADAVATRIGNEVGEKRGSDYGIGKALELAQEVPGISGAVIVCRKVFGAMGTIELVQLKPKG